MTKQIPYDRATLLKLLESTFEQALTMISRLDYQKLNMVPFAGSWTSAQVAEHLTLSNHSIARALALTGTQINREQGERIGELKNIFLNFKNRFEAPSFILPPERIYTRTDVIESFRLSFEQILKQAGQADLSTMINHDAFGDITKFEIIHFVLYHTQRHMHQLEKIYDYITTNKVQN